METLTQLESDIELNDMIVVYICDCLCIWFKQLKDPIDRFDCVFLFNWILENNPSFDDLIQFNVSLVCRMISSISEKNLSTLTRIEIIKDKIMDSGLEYKLF